MKLPKRLTGKNYGRYPLVKELPYIKEGYKTKNSFGGRKCVFRQSKDYREIRYSAIPWFQGVPSDSVFIPAPNPVRAENETQI